MTEGFNRVLRVRATCKNLNFVENIFYNSCSCEPSFQNPVGNSSSMARENFRALSTCRNERNEHRAILHERLVPFGIHSSQRLGEIARYSILDCCSPSFVHLHEPIFQNCLPTHTHTPTHARARSHTHMHSHRHIETNAHTQQQHDWGASN